MRRGLLDVEYEDLVKNGKQDDESQAKRIDERIDAIGRAHWECAMLRYFFLH